MTNEKYNIPISEICLLTIERTLNIVRKKIPAFQRYINRKADNKYGITFLPHDSNTSIDDVFSEYWYNDIQREDIVLDIGSNVGAFSLFVSKFVEHVYAIEPVLYHIAKRNVAFNHIKNITVIDTALGEGLLDIPWEGYKSRKIIGKSLTEIIQLCNLHPTFLKLDCEGGEWCIKPHELKGIRRIEAEIHNFDGKHNTMDFLRILNEAGFNYEYTSPRTGLLQIHARKINNEKSF